MACDEVVGMIAVGDSFMSAAAAVLVTDIVTTAGVPAAAFRRILGIHLQLVFIHMVAMHKVHVPIVKETLVPIVH
jgi:CRP-like cAMP-binding protein